MTRWGKPTKNKRRRTTASIKYRLDEQEEYTDVDMHSNQPYTTRDTEAAEGTPSLQQWIERTINQDQDYLELVQHGDVLALKEELMELAQNYQGIGVDAGSQPYAGVAPDEFDIAFKDAIETLMSPQMNESSKRKGIQELFEGFNRFLNESEEEDIEAILNTDTGQGKLSGGLKWALYPHLTSGMMSGPVSKLTAMRMIKAAANDGYYYDDREQIDSSGKTIKIGEVPLADGELFALEDVYRKLGGTGRLIITK